MARRYRVNGEDDAWVADVNGSSVELEPAEEPSGERRRVRIQDDVDGRHLITEDTGDTGRTITEDTERTEVSLRGVAVRSGDDVWVTIDGYVLRYTVHSGDEGERATARDHDALVAPMPATVVRIAVAAGDQVKRGDLIMVLEAMKMELPIRAPRDMTIGAIACRVGELVPAGKELVTA